MAEYRFLSDPDNYVIDNCKYSRLWYVEGEGPVKHGFTDFVGWWIEDPYDDEVPYFGMGYRGSNYRSVGIFSDEGEHGPTHIEKIDGNHYQVYIGTSEAGYLWGPVCCYDSEGLGNGHNFGTLDFKGKEGPLNPNSPTNCDDCERPEIPFTPDTLVAAFRSRDIDFEEGFLEFEENPTYRDNGHGFGIVHGLDHDSFGYHDRAFLDGIGIMCYHDQDKGTLIGLEFSADDMIGYGVRVISHNGEKNRITWGMFVDENEDGDYGTYENGVCLTYRDTDGFTVERYDKGELVETIYREDFTYVGDKHIDSVASMRLFLALLTHMAVVDTEYFSVPTWLATVSDACREAFTEAYDLWTEYLEE